MDDKCRFIMPDLRGHGLSSAGEGPATMASLAEDVLCVCEAAKVKKAIFFGCSIGGYILFELWRRHPEVFRGMILSSTKAEADTEAARQQRLISAEEALGRGPSDVIDSMLPKLLGESTKCNHPEVVSAVKAIMKRTTGEGIAAVQRGMAEREDSTETLATITVPTLVFGGEEDIICPIDGMEAMAGGIPHSEFSSVARAGHLAAYENPDEVSRIVRPFLERLNNF